MKKNWWWRWTVERPAAFGDWLWLVLVVLPADFLDRLTFRKAVALLLPVAILTIAFAHNVPLPPEVLFLGDALAYLDLLTIFLMLAALGRARQLLYAVQYALGNAARWLAKALARPRADSRHRRAHSESSRKRSPRGSAKAEEDGFLFPCGAPA